MSRLKTRARKRAGAFHDRFGTAGVVIAVIALVAALSGTALAAKGALTGKQKKEVEKIAKKFAGKNGENGAPGEKGAPGTNGKDGTPGTPGESVTLAAAGSCPNEGTKVTVGTTSEEICNGTNGTPGEDGHSPEVVTEFDSTDAECEHNGGIEYEVEGAGSSVVCNGREGSPWTAGGTLPGGATETGVWAFNAGMDENEHEVFVPVSFSIPLGVDFLFNAHVHFGVAGEGGAFSENGACPSETPARPEAAPGELCVYQFEVGLEFAEFLSINKLQPFNKGANSSGALMKIVVTGGESPPPNWVASGAGSFAVTGCDETEDTVAGVTCKY
jgi:hypothetical protein